MDPTTASTETDWKHIFCNAIKDLEGSMSLYTGFYPTDDYNALYSWVYDLYDKDNNRLNYTLESIVTEFKEKWENKVQDEYFKKDILESFSAWWEFRKMVDAYKKWKETQ